MLNADDMYKQHKVFGWVNAQCLILWGSGVALLLFLAASSWLLAVIVASVLFNKVLGDMDLNGGVLYSLFSLWTLCRLLGFWEWWLKRRYSKVVDVMNALERVT